MRTPLGKGPGGRTVRSPEGFTLLELLLSMAVLAVLAVIALGAFDIGRRAWEKGGQAMERQQHLRGVVDRLRRQVASAVPVPALDGLAAPLAFDGRQDAVRFVAELSLVPGTGRGRVVVDYRVEARGDGRETLLVHEAPLAMLDPRQAFAPQASAFLPLLEEAAEIRFEYADVSPEAGELTWAERWETDVGRGLPAAVRLSIRTADEEAVRLAMVTRLADPEAVTP